MVRYKILRGLESLLSQMRLQREERELVQSVLRTTTLRALELLRWEAALGRGRPAHATVGAQLLRDLVRDKQQLAMGRILLLVSLLYPTENIATIRAGVRSRRGRRQASGVELLENLVPSDLRAGVRALWSSDSPAARLRATSGRLAEPLSYETAVRELGRDDSEALRAFAMYHASEISLMLEDEDDDESGLVGIRRLEGLRSASLSLLERLPEAVARRAFGVGHAATS
jgi:hypothetical protein